MINDKGYYYLDYEFNKDDTERLLQLEDVDNFLTESEDNPQYISGIEDSKHYKKVLFNLNRKNIKWDTLSFFILKNKGNHTARNYRVCCDIGGYHCEE